MKARKNREFHWITLGRGCGVRLRVVMMAAFHRRLALSCSVFLIVAVPNLAHHSGDASRSSF